MRMTIREYNELKKKTTKELRIRSAGKARSVYKSDKIDDAYKQAVETLHHLQGSNGTLFLGESRFTLWTQIFGESRKADGSNVYKGIEDGLNKIAYRDDQQNITFELPKPLRESFDKGDMND